MKELIQVLESGQKLDQMYLDAINSQAETMHYLLIIVFMLTVSQGLMHLQLILMSRKLNGEKE